MTLRARYVFPVEGEAIADGLVEVRQGRIAACGRADGTQADLDLGNVAIVPGFVNAHTHLELSPVKNGAADRGDDEIAWLRRVIDQRRGSSRPFLEAAVARNLRAVVEAGTTCVADITTGGLSWERVAGAPVRAVVFAEMLGLGRMRGLQTSQEAFDWLATIKLADQVAACARPGLSPHAPYSTAGWLYHRAADSGLPLTTHLAEMPEELTLLRDRGGRLREFLEDLGAWDESWEPIGPRPADYVRRDQLRRSDWLIAHGTYLDEADFWQLRPEAAPQGQRVAVAFCPRTHARFGHAPHPYREMLKRGVIVCLGTDSRASSPSLSILDEMRFLHRSDPSLSGPLLFTMATLFGAWALRADSVTGSLKPGKSADLTMIALPDREAADPHQLVLDSELPVVGSVFEGEFVTGSWA
jgi:cytosine/adenosine deaminase-related metal-dependent hydrolase